MTTKLNLIVNRYTDPDPGRDAELQQAWQINMQIGVFDQIEDFFSQGRPTLGDYFRHCRADAVNVVANSDISFDQTIQLARQIPPGHLWALLRWEQDKATGRWCPWEDRSNSQDVWIFRGAPCFGLEAPSLRMACPGIDNRWARLAADAGWSVFNPCRSIRTFHHHDSHIRRNTPKECIPGPYRMLPPCDCPLLIQDVESACNA